MFHAVMVMIVTMIIIIVIPKMITMFWCCYHGRAIARVHPVHAMNVEQRQTAADPWANPTGLSHISPPVGS